MFTPMTSKAGYIGRFAPSPSGPLHFGSLIAAVASYVDARANHGHWLLRMEDLDPAREPPQAAGQILSTLERFGLFWDGSVLYQSQRLTAYADALEQLQQQGLIYPCDCSRQEIRELGGVYNNHCRQRPLAAVAHGALRVCVDDFTISFDDRIQGLSHQHLLHECGDFVVLRKDGLFAYQLAVVVDDGFQGVTDIVRGSDLLDSTPRQLYLQQSLGYPRPRYAHVPVAANQAGQKLSKQHFARPLDTGAPSRQLIMALAFLGQAPIVNLEHESVQNILQWAVDHWDIQAVPKLANIQHEDID
jgi:glutamyl-Q tRNA(Asp) synthetase